MNFPPTRALVHDILKERGLDTPYEVVQQELREKHTRTVGIHVFYKERTRMLAEQQALTPIVEKVERVQAEPERPDQLHDFIRFACAVEAIGGIEKAKAMIAHLERLYELQPEASHAFPG